ncbi:olfactory receptor 52K1-like [Pelobates fuscus]|uniref:olfactory receptor 52K1-like n=1 Tax=Pelobates fuscus TaxID=191477 RepID=UPI002FE4C229
MANQSDVSEFILIGFPGLPQTFYPLVSVTMFLVYTIALMANGTVILLISLRERLHHPMYLIISNLAFSDLTFDTITLPKIIARYWFKDESISFSTCMFQLFFVHYLGVLDSFIIMLMSADRYIAICKPLRYSAIMTNKLAASLCCLLSIIAAAFGLAVSILTGRQFYCRSNKINGCFCSNSALLALACGDVFYTKRVNFSLAMIVLCVPLVLIILSYIVILRTISSLRRPENWQKAFYTCTTHLFIISLYYIPRIFVYTSNQINLIANADFNILLLCLYTFVPHLANPIIYCLRTKEIKKMLINIYKR